MTIIAWVCWILIWGLAGFFTVRAIQVRNEMKRTEKAMIAWYQDRQLLMNLAGKYNNTNLSSNPFEDLNKKDV